MSGGAFRAEPLWRALGWARAEVPLPDASALRLVATDPSGARIHRAGELYRIDHPFGATVRVDGAGRRFAFDAAGTDPSDLAHVIDNFVVPRLVAHDGALVLHAALVATPFGAVAVCADSGMGKSTLGAGLRREGWPLMGDDAAILSESGGRPMARPTYARLSLHDDSALALLGAGARTGYKHDIDLEGDPDLEAPVEARPLAAVFILERAGVARPISRPLSPAAATMALVANSFALDPARPETVRGRLERAAALRDRVPVRTLDYPRRYDAFGALKEALAGLLEGL